MGVCLVYHLHRLRTEYFRVLVNMGVEEDIRDGHKCDHCDKIFSVASNRYFLQKLLKIFLHSHQMSRNRHMKRMHEGKVQDKSVTCSLCSFTCRDRWNGSSSCILQN